jgi:hypothetical protein
VAQSPMTEQQLTVYQPLTTSGAALKERLEATVDAEEEIEGNRSLLR